MRPEKCENYGRLKRKSDGSENSRKGALLGRVRE